MNIAVAGYLPDGRPVERVAISGGSLSAQILTFGAIVQGIRLAPFAHSLVLGFDDLGRYLSDAAYIGAVVGRVANRIGRGRLSIGNSLYQIDRNEGGINTLHGGADGVARKLWRVEDHGSSHVTLGLHLPDGHMGFPGAIDLSARYAISDGGVFEITLGARTDSLTVCNLAPHLYFNLDGGGDARDHMLRVDARHFLPTMPDGIPTGERCAVAGTPWDFRAARTLRGGAYDHNFCLAGIRRTMTPAARLSGATSGISMALETTEPGLQVYDGAGLDAAWSGVALEPQSWPDAPNQSRFPSISLHPGESLRQSTRLTFAGGRAETR